jgi:hypothetical protein
MFAEKTTTNKGGTNTGAGALSADRQALQRKLSVGSSNDPQEQEADKTADTVMRQPEQGFVQRKCADCEKEEQLQRKCADCEKEEQLQRQPSGDGQTSGNGQPAVNDRTASILQSSAGKGASLDGPAQSFMSNRMNNDFGEVKIHTDEEAVQLSRELNAKAFTVGKDIYFNEGQYQPGSESGRHLLAHELTHTVQQTGGAPVVQKKDAVPDKLETDKQSILEALHKSDAPIFLSRLRALDAAEAASLLADTGFWQEIKKNFHGSALWSAFTILFFHGKMSLNQRMLSVALFSKNITDAMDDLAVIIARENVADPMYWDVLEEVIFTVFAGDPKLPDLYKLLILPKSQYSGPRNLSFRSSEVHYEELKDKKGDYALKAYHNTRQQVAYSTRSELRAVVTIRLVDAQNKTQGFNFTGAESGVPAAWKTAIEAAWNNQFELSNGIDTLKFTVSPMFTSEAGHEDAVVEIHNDRKQKCDTVDQPGRETSACWFTDTGTDTVSHEFGHLLGANDEYQLPGSAAEIPADMKKDLSADDIALSNMTDIKNDERPAGSPPVAPIPFKKAGYTITGQMGHHEKDSVEVKGRHIRLLINAFNASLPPGTPPYIIKKI